MSQLQPIDRSELVAQPDMNTLMMTALQHGEAGASSLEKLVALQERIQDRQAKREAAAALAKFQRDCPAIEHDKPVLNKDGRSVRYTYATLEHVIACIQPHEIAHGLTHRWNMRLEEGRVEATCIITHEGGHEWTASFTGTVDKAAYMSDTQKDASADSYAKRRSLLDALGIITRPKGKAGEQVTSDDDGYGGGVQSVSEEQARAISEWLHDSGADKEKFLAWVRQSCASPDVVSVETIPAKHYAACIAALRQKKGH